MLTRTHVWIVTLLLTVVLEGCESRNQPAGTSSPPLPSPPSESTPAPGATRPTDQWLGKWTGPEGTYLVLSKDGGQYAVEVHSLDGPATYGGAPAGDHIEFRRNGKTESIHAGSGQETGMKWLLDKKNCLIIKTGEGFCRE